MFAMCIFAAQDGVSKEGNCPTIEVPDDIECPSPEELKTECLFDTDCKGTEKCCSDGCTMKCANASLPATPKTIVGPKGPRGDKGEPVCIFLLFYESIILRYEDLITCPTIPLKMYLD